jgi:GNAT superfamily N-acetyltransferase
MKPAIQIAENDADILKCQKVLLALRPQLKERNFIEIVRRTLADNRKLIYIEEAGQAVSAAIFEWGHNLYRGSYIYIDDVSTLPEARGKGYAGELLRWISEYAVQNSMEQIHLDSGVNENRRDAHRLYLNHGFHITSLHFARTL